MTPKSYREIQMTHAAAAAKSLQSCPTLCNPRDGSLPGSSVPGILQARTQEWVAISFSNAWEWKVKVELLSRARLRDPMDCSPPGSSVHGNFPGKGTGVGCHCLLHLEGHGTPKSGKRPVTANLTSVSGMIKDGKGADNSNLFQFLTVT